ncbi:MAG TPA: branched-chain amino acid ABC transporter substrate-binding protein [Herpetosiphonaceae bacterium]|nr:branched-chain amino acid ABC transporter substrate-binding protein [Herpetosiphonaceae bacterium]
MKRILSFALTLVMVMSILAACGTSTPTAVPTAAGGAATTAPAPGDPTTAPSTGGAMPASIKIVSSLPRTGSSKGQTDTIVNAIKMRLEEDNNTICDGKVQVKYEDLDDATAAKGAWDEAKEAENANAAAADKDVLVYIGTFNSGAAKISIPILNQAGVVMISPANTAVGLTKPFEPGEPDVYYPTGKRNYTRVIPADDFQGAAGANWAKELGIKTVYVLDDTELYGKGLADVFEKTATANGITVLGRDGIDPKASDYKALMTKIKDTNPELIYFGGITQSNAGQLVKDMRAVMPADQVKFMGPDGIFEAAFIEAAGAENAEGAYITFGGVPPSKLEGKGAEWYNAYKAKFNSEPEAYAVYGYEAVNVALSALNKSCDNLTRENVLTNVFATKDFTGVLGTWSFDANGDTTLSELSGQQIKGGKFEYVGLIK